MEENVAAVEEEAIVVEDFVGAAEGAAAAETVAPPKKKRKGVNQAKLQDNLWGWIFCIPLIVGTVWFVYSALIMALMLSFTDFRIGDGGTTLFECLGNYKNWIAHSPVMEENAVGDLVATGEFAYDPFRWYKNIFTMTSSYNITGSSASINQMGAYLFNTVFYMIGIPIGMILSMFFAVCMSRDIKGGNVFRVLYYIPCVASSISIVYTFKLLFDQSGVINSLFGSKALNWLGVDQSWNDLLYKNSPTKSSSVFMNAPFWCSGFINKCVIVIMSVWKGLGGTIILYVAGLSGVNAATKEAAQIDGANGWKIFWKVTMPDLYPVIFYNIVTSVIGGMQIYAEPVLFFGEAGLKDVTQLSNTSGYVSLVYIYGVNGQASNSALNIIESNRYPSAGAAYGMFLAVIIFVLTLFQFWLDSRKKD